MKHNYNQVYLFATCAISCIMFWQMLKTPLSYDLRPVYTAKKGGILPLKSKSVKTVDNKKLSFHVGEDGFSKQADACKPPHSFVFHKKHKCASSTLQTVMKNFGRLHGIPREPATFGSVGGGYPGVYNPALRPTPQRNVPVGMAIHQRMNIEVECDLFPPGTMFITSIREPESFFRSMFHYFYQKYANLKQVSQRPCGVQCWGMPFAKWMGSAEKGEFQYKFGVTPNEVLDVLDDVYDGETDWAFRAKNFQAFELGFDYEETDTNYIKSKIQSIDRHYEFVAVAEYFFESLVLLREILCVPWVVLFAKSRMVSAEYEKKVFTANQVSVLRRHFYQDYAIYEHFNTSLWNRIEQYGPERMENDVRELKKLYEKCNADPKLCHFDTVDQYEYKDNSKTFESYATSELLDYMKDNLGACSWGAYNRLLNGNKTGCPQDRDFFSEN